MERVKTTYDRPDGLSSEMSSEPIFRRSRQREDDLRFLDTLTSLLTQVLPTLSPARQAETAVAVCELARVSPD